MMTLEGRLALARREVARREQEAAAVTPKYPHITTIPSVGAGAMKLVVSWQEGAYARSWHIEVPEDDVTELFLSQLEAMATRREQKHIRLMK